MLNYQATIQKQFANSPVILRILSNINAYIDPAAVLDTFYDQIWNVATAQGYGLDLWGRIVGVSRVLQVANTVYFSFNGGPFTTTFGQAIFYTGSAVTSNYSLSDDAFRTLIYAKAMSNISNGSITSINAILMVLFGSSGACWCTDGGNMTMTYTFTFTPTNVQLAIINETGILPKPTGVSVTVVT